MLDNVGEGPYEYQESDSSMQYGYSASELIITLKVELPHRCYLKGEPGLTITTVHEFAGATPPGYFLNYSFS